MIEHSPYAATSELAWSQHAHQGVVHDATMMAAPGVPGAPGARQYEQLPPTIAEMQVPSPPLLAAATNITTHLLQPPVVKGAGAVFSGTISVVQNQLYHQLTGMTVAPPMLPTSVPAAPVFYG